MFKRTLKATLAAAMFGFAASSAQAAIVASIGGTGLANNGQVSSVCIVGCTTVNFNSPTPLGAVLPAGYSLVGGGFAQVVNGTVQGAYAAPQSLPPAAFFPNSTQYLAVSGTGGAANQGVVITPGGSLNYFGMWAGSIDTFNSISFYNGATLVGTITGSALQQLPDPDLVIGNQQQAAYFNFLLTGGDSYTSIVLGSTGIAFESDNHTFGSVVIPVPGAAALMLSGLFGLVFVSRRSKKAAQIA